MARILCATEGNWISHVARSLQVGRALRRAGHAVEFACSGSQTGILEADGFSVHPLATKDPHFGLSAARRQGSSYDDAIVRRYVESEIACLRELRPDAVVGDFRLTLGISTEALGIPYVSLLNGYWTNYYAVRHHVPDSLAVVEALGTAIPDLLFPLLRRRFLRRAAAPFNRERARHGLAPRGNLFDVMASDGLNLVVDLPEFTPVEAMPASFRYAGPILWEPDLPLPDWASRLERGRPTVYATFGSTGAERLLDEIVALYASSEVQLVVGGIDAAGIRALPDNVHVAKLLPGMKLMALSDVVICHGGNGTIYQALSQGVPIVGIPTMHDQWFNMERVEALGAGLKVSERRFSRDRLRDAVDRVLHEPGFRAAARALSARVLAMDGAANAARFIGEWLAGDVARGH